MNFLSSHAMAFFFLLKIAKVVIFLGFPTPMKKLGAFWVGSSLQVLSKMATTLLTGALGMLALVEVGTRPVHQNTETGEVPRNCSAKILSPKERPKRKAGLFFRTQAFLFSVFFFDVKLRVVEEVEMS